MNYRHDFEAASQRMAGLMRRYNVALLEGNLRAVKRELSRLQEEVSNAERLADTAVKNRNSNIQLN